MTHCLVRPRVKDQLPSRSTLFSPLRCAACLDYWVGGPHTMGLNLDPCFHLTIYTWVSCIANGLVDKVFVARVAESNSIRRCNSVAKKLDIFYMPCPSCLLGWLAGCLVFVPVQACGWQTCTPECCGFKGSHWKIKELQICTRKLIGVDGSLGWARRSGCHRVLVAKEH